MSAKKNIVAVDLFCGAGGLTHGLQKAGINVQLGLDIDPACAHPINTNNNTKFIQADITKLETKVITDVFAQGSISLLAGCAPCQPFSTYSQKSRRGDADEESPPRNDDWKLVGRFGDIIRETKPDLVTMENVPPLYQQPIFQRLLTDLSDYNVDYRVVECRAIGLPQTRKRLVLVASRFGEIKIPDFESQPITVRETIAALPEIKAGGQDPCDRLHRASKLSKTNLQRIRASVPGGTWRDWPEALRAACHKKETGATYPSVYGRMEWDAPAPTITTQCFGYGNGRFGHPSQDRAISLREAAMLQGFPRDYSFIPEDEPVSFSKLGRLIGNAVPVTLAETIGRIFIEHIDNMQ